jgi:hypothetical protein
MQLAIAARAPVDHVIFYTVMELPRWAVFFSALGFTVTPLGRHSTGSANHLVVLQDSYIELIGFEAGAPPDARPELRALPEGLSGIAFRGVPDPSWPACCAGRFHPTTSLERPVAMDGVHGTARFRLTNLREPPTGLRVFMCDHLTPEWIWTPAWKRHANGAMGIPGVQFSTPSPKPVHSALRAAMGLPEAQGDESTYQAGGTTIEVIPDGRSAVTVATVDLPALGAQLADGAIPFARRSDGSLRVPLPGGAQADLVFVQA